MGRLGTLKVPHFNGCLRDWAGFRNMFVSLVDTRPDFTKLEKLAYLRSFLKGEPRQLVQHMELQDANYDTAMQLLGKRYEKPRLQADAHITHMLNLPKVNYRANLRAQLITPLTVSLNGLRTLGLPVDQWSFLLLHIVRAKLSQEMRDEFERQRLADKDLSGVVPSIGELLEFLEKEAGLLENQQASQEAPRIAPARTSGVNGVQQPCTPGRGRGRLVAAAAIGPGSGCRVCGLPHLERQCKKLISMQVRDRRNLARTRALCYACLEGHRYNECTQARPCGVCAGLHHPLLCTRRGNESAKARGGRSPTGGGVAPWTTPSQGRGSPPRPQQATPPYTPAQEGWGA